MIERYVFIKLKDEHLHERGALAQRIAEVVGTVPGVVGVRAGTPAEERSASAWDLSVAIRFERLEDVEPYKVHPDHRRLVDEELRPKMIILKAWNFALSGD